MESARSRGRIRYRQGKVGDGVLVDERRAYTSAKLDPFALTGLVVENAESASEGCTPIAKDIPGKPGPGTPVPERWIQEHGPTVKAVSVAGLRKRMNPLLS